MFPSSTAFLPPSVMNFTGCRSENKSSSIQLFLCSTVSCGTRVLDRTLSSGEFFLWSAESTFHLTWTLPTRGRTQTLPLGTPHSEWSCTVVSSRVGYSRSQHPRTRLSSLSWNARAGCSAFETGFIRAAFSVAAIRAWNGLPVDIRQITDTKLFKKKLKTFLFNSA